MSIPRQEIVAISEQSTVVAQYEENEKRPTSYQSEAELEAEFIGLLQEQAYEYAHIKDEKALIANLRQQIQTLNKIQLSDTEWERFFTHCIAGAGEGIEEKTRRIQEDYVQPLILDNGETINLHLIDKKDIHNNQLQVINQYEVPATKGGAGQTNRYDVTILVNGLPLVHVELKRRGVALKEAFNQINRYGRESFYAGSGLFNYVQIFVISNGTETKYYSNTTRDGHLKESRGGKTSSRNPKPGAGPGAALGSGRRQKSGSQSFEFTCWWTDASNRPLHDLRAFTRTFFAKHSLLPILTRYCVFTSDQRLLVMRPYQIVAAERIINRVKIALNTGNFGQVEAGGYVWHTTGSGKTLTSFKAARLASKMPGIDKVIFVVDRKDLDYQTMAEYDSFEKGSANSNSSTAILMRQLGDPNAHIIITTIQKLSHFIKNNAGHKVLTDKVVFIFDECHRSQFGNMHKAITKSFKNYIFFGFTGTPIFAENAGSALQPGLQTTEQAFGQRLHTYTIADAIDDKNVLPFLTHYYNSIAVRPGISEEKIVAIDTEKALMDKRRIAAIATYILESFDRKTLRKNMYEHRVIDNVDAVARAKRTKGKPVEISKSSRRVGGFNAMLATSCILAARMYYNKFCQLQEEKPEAQRLKIATIFSWSPNEDPAEETLGMLEDETLDTEGMDQSSRQFLEEAIQDYNAMFKTSYDTSSEGFANYYRDVSMRMKNREIDLLIVANMFLTGFDAPTLNTLYVDKNLRSHGLIQAYSRTNRILNSVKAYGNIVAFRDLEGATQEALKLFGDKDAAGIVILKPYKEYIGDYRQIVAQLVANFPPGQEIVGEKAKAEFVRLFGSLLKIENILNSFDEFDQDVEVSERDHQDYMSNYLDIHTEITHKQKAEKTVINDDLVFEIELVKQVEINVDYILDLVETRSGSADIELKSQILKAVDASPTLRSKKDLIEAFVDHMCNPGSNTGIDAGSKADSETGSGAESEAESKVESKTENTSASASKTGHGEEEKDLGKEFRDFINLRQNQELEQIIAEEHLQAEETKEFVQRAFQTGLLSGEGTAITRILPPTSRFAAPGEISPYEKNKNQVLARLQDFFDRFHPLLGSPNQDG